MTRKSPIIRCAVALLLLPGTAHPFCFDEAGRAYGVSPLLLRGIARVESNMNPAATNRNANGSIDLGLMQVNSFWLKPLGTTSEELLRDPCYNVMAGAWILRGCMDRHGETWNAVGCYNASSHDKRVNYSWKVYRELLKGARTAGSENNGPGVGPPRRANAVPATVRESEGKRAVAPVVSSMQISVTEKN